MMWLLTEWNVENTTSTPRWSAVESWSDMWCGGGHTHPPIDHWQLRVEVTCDVEDPPYPTPHQQLRVEATCVVWRTHPTLPPLAILMLVHIASKNIILQCRHNETQGVRLVIIWQTSEINLATSVSFQEIIFLVPSVFVTFEWMYIVVFEVMALWCRTPLLSLDNSSLNLESRDTSSVRSASR